MGATGELLPLERLCTEDVLHVRNLPKWFFNYEKIKKLHRK